MGLSLLVSAAGAGDARPHSVAYAAEGGPVVPIIFPMEKRVQWTDTFGAPRSGGRTHEGNDIMVPKMTPLLACADGELDFMNMDLELSSYNDKPYFNILLRGADGNDYFYIHLNNDTPGTDDGNGGLKYAYAAGLTNGSQVKKGQLIGWAGDSGNAEDSGSHLHFELHTGGYKNPVDPYNTLKAAPTWAEWQAGQGSTSTTLPPTTTTTEPSLVPFDDVRAADWYYPELLKLYEGGVVKGSADNLFNAYSEVTRAQFAALLVRCFWADQAAPSESDPAAGGTPSFSDVSPDHWAYGEVTTAAQLGLVLGVGDGSQFRPDSSITRAQMAAMISRTVDLVLGEDGPAPLEGQQRLFIDVPGDHWAAEPIAESAALGVLMGDADRRFRPDETSKRAHAVAVIARTLALSEPEGS
jgi:hypothetical protein